MMIKMMMMMMIMIMIRLCKEPKRHLTGGRGRTVKGEGVEA